MNSDRQPEPAEPTDVVEHRQHAADPETLTVAERRNSPIADISRDDISTDDLPTPLVECGCGGCGPMVDPLDRYEGGGGLDWSSFDTATWAQTVCENPQPMSIRRAGKVFRRYTKAKLADDRRTSKAERERSNYRRIMDVDRYSRDAFGGNLTTVMLSFRVSPTTADGVTRRWVSPLLLADVLSIYRQQVHNRALNIREHVDEVQYVWVTTGTEKYATPHRHLYLWCDDPDDDVRILDFRSAVRKHCEGHQACEGAHQITDSEGEHRAVTVNHDPIIVDTETGTTVETPKGTTVDMSAIRREVRRSENEPYHEATAGALYVASQLPYLCALNDGPHPVNCQSAAVKWAHNAVSNRRWFGMSQKSSN